jgi:hypothetical protein
MYDFGENHTRYVLFRELDILPQGRQFDIKKTNFRGNPSFLKQIICDYLLASSIATATATDILSLLVVTCVEASCFYGEQERYN